MRVFSCLYLWDRFTRANFHFFDSWFSITPWSCSGWWDLNDGGFTFYSSFVLQTEPCIQRFNWGGVLTITSLGILHLILNRSSYNFCSKTVCQHDWVRYFVYWQRHRLGRHSGRYSIPKSICQLWCDAAENQPTPLISIRNWFLYLTPEIRLIIYRHVLQLLYLIFQPCYGKAFLCEVAQLGSLHLGWFEEKVLTLSIRENTISFPTWFPSRRIADMIQNISIDILLYGASHQRPREHLISFIHTFRDPATIRGTFTVKFIRSPNFCAAMIWISMFARCVDSPTSRNPCPVSWQSCPERCYSPQSRPYRRLCRKTLYDSCWDQRDLVPREALWYFLPHWFLDVWLPRENIDWMDHLEGLRLYGSADEANADRNADESEPSAQNLSSQGWMSRRESQKSLGWSASMFSFLSKLNKCRDSAIHVGIKIDGFKRGTIPFVCLSFFSNFKIRSNHIHSPLTTSTESWNSYTAYPWIPSKPKNRAVTIRFLFPCRSTISHPSSMIQLAQEISLDMCWPTSFTYSPNSWRYCSVASNDGWGRKCRFAQSPGRIFSGVSR